MATKITLKQLGDDILEYIKKNSGGEGGSLDHDITSNVAVGAAPANTKFDEGLSLTEFAEKILLKEVVPTISTSFSGTGLKEKGNSVNGTTMTLNITNLSSISNTITVNEIKFYDGNTVIDTQAFVPGKSTYTYTYNITISDNKTVKAELTYNSNKKLSGSGTFTFVYPRFYGVRKKLVEEGPPRPNSTTNELATLYTKEVVNGKGLTWNNITLDDERFCYIYPASFGELSSIKDGNNFEQLQSYTKYTIDVDSSLTGETILYYMYILTDSATGTGFKQIYS